jgi:hypothetical protein
MERLQHNVPKSDAPIADLQTGRVTRAWYLSLISLFQILQERTVTVGASPFSFVASDSGNLLVAGGNVSQIALQRVGSYVTGLTAGFIPVSEGDVVTITYTVAPSVVFFPR